MEDIVAQHQTDVIVANELLADDESLGQPIGARLLGIRKAHAEVRPIAQQTTEAVQVVRRGDNQNVTDASQHQDADGIIHHRLVIDGQKLFAHPLGDGVKTGAGTAGQYNAFHQ